MNDKLEITLYLKRDFSTDLFVVHQELIDLNLAQTPSIDLNVKQTEEVTLER